MNEQKEIFDVYANKISMTSNPIDTVLTLYKDTPDVDNPEIVTSEVLGRVRINPSIMEQVCNFILNSSQGGNRK